MSKSRVEYRVVLRTVLETYDHYLDLGLTPSAAKKRVLTLYDDFKEWAEGDHI